MESDVGTQRSTHGIDGVKVLVLNHTYEPLHFCNVKRAIIMKNVFRRDNYPCQYCGRMGPDLTIDHILPRSLGGKTSWDNVVVACQACNVRKGNRRLDETDMRLLRKVKPPPFVVFLNFPPPSAQAFLKIWRNYLPDERDLPT